jgi:two-component system, chemotaxis family, protein-glutamate methylesterase/glutaminase
LERIIIVLVVDDSAYVRKVVTQMLLRSPFIEVVGTAFDGEDALEQVEQLNPDVITLDLIMPNMDGVEFLQRQMAVRPLPVVVVSIASESGEKALEALDAGAIEFVQKPTALSTERIFEISDELIQKVKMAASIPLAQLPSALALAAEPAIAPVAAIHHGLVDAVVIGTSTGGPQALRYLAPQLPSDLPVPVGIVLHMPLGYTELYAAKLDEISGLSVCEARHGMVVQPGHVYLAPAGRHLTFVRTGNGQVLTHLDTRPFDTPHRPAVDILFRSAAEAYHNRVLAVVMTGMGADGQQGAAWIKARGGLVYTEAEESCVVYGMPRAVVEAGLSDRSLPLTDIAAAILEVV